MISAIILAAGEGRRMKSLKQLLPLGGSTVLEMTVNEVIASRVNETIVVLGFQAEKIRAKLELKPVKFALNSRYRSGMGTSIITGISSADSRAGAFLLVLGDQPFTRCHIINRLLEEYSRHNKNIVIPVFGGKRGHPVLISKNYKNELLALRGDIGARELISRNPQDVFEVQMDSPEVVIDLDTPEDYMKYS